MDFKRVAKDTAKTIISYLTYQAVRTVVAQLYETDPPQGIWLNQFSTQSTIQDGEAYLAALFEARPALAFRILTVREHLAEQVCDWLPELVRAGIQQANVEHRRGQLERMTQVDMSQSVPTSADANDEISEEPNSETDPQP